MSPLHKRSPQMSANSIFTSPVAGSGYNSIKPNSKTLFPGKDSIAWSRKSCLKWFKNSLHEGKTWNPINNKKFETLSYIPRLSYDSIAKEIDYILKKGWIPCLEFDEVLNEINECKKTYPNAYIHCLAFNNVKQGQCMAFLIQNLHSLLPKKHYALPCFSL
ncbi:hypothetical protein Dsin_008553 [Dipteronia sinensis]|uniref:Ribulose bisphosphate carboxylase small subunit n=1 Tax=Dipteronia sinensis TaxID=43782 RepID=A0AAE0EAS6_9ROSI|nr:hypothetical protein Dsin_008553 [Dipteronia sinensis]